LCAEKRNVFWRASWPTTGPRIFLAMLCVVGADEQVSLHIHTRIHTHAVVFFLGGHLLTQPIRLYPVGGDPYGDDCRRASRGQGRDHLADPFRRRHIYSSPRCFRILIHVSRWHTRDIGARRLPCPTLGWACAAFDGAYTGCSFCAGVHQS